jgi:hypothetical protein
MENNDFYKTNKCLDKEQMFVLCMKIPNPIDNKCKNLFDKWYKCLMLDNTNQIKIK